MEDSFRVRVDKAFGNLSSNDSSSVAVTPSLWTLTDEEIEKRVWNRNKQVEEEEEEEILKSGPRNHLDSDLNELSDDDEDDRDEIDAEEKIRHHNISGGVNEYFDVLSSIGRDRSLDFKRNMAADDEEEEEEVEQIDGEEKKRRQNSSGDAEADEYLDVQSNIGRDCTLDYEEEEDEYDKVAVGMEQSDDRIYMRNVKYAEYAVDEVNGYGELPNTFQNVVRDPRANHLAAKIRLKEDAEAAGFGTLQLSDHPIATNSGSKDHRNGELDVDNPKPILKKKENPESRSQKRVRFVVDPNSSTHQGQQSSGASDAASEPNARDDNAVPVQESDPSLHSAGVPDYLRNPSKYRRYTFDSTDDVDEESNRKACMDFFDNLRRRNADTFMEDTSMEIPKSIVFTPKKKPEQDSTEKRGEGEHKTRGNQENKSWSFGITAEDTQESEVSAMEEDEPVSAGEHSSRKSGRQYRTRTNIDIDDNVD